MYLQIVHTLVKCSLIWFLERAQSHGVWSPNKIASWQAITCFWDKNSHTGVWKLNYCSELQIETNHYKTWPKSMLNYIILTLCTFYFSETFFSSKSNQEGIPLRTIVSIQLNGEPKEDLQMAQVHYSIKYLL